MTEAEQIPVVATSTPILTRVEIKQKLISIFGEGSDMVNIASCESHYRQFKPDGSVLRGEINPLDTGIFMINEKYWLEKSIELGFNIYTTEGNIAMAKWIFDHQGTQPWHWSYEMRPGVGWKYGECK